MDRLLRSLQPYVRRYRQGGGDSARSAFVHFQLPLYLTTSIAGGAYVYYSFCEWQKLHYPPLAEALERDKESLRGAKEADWRQVQEHYDKTAVMRRDMNSRQ